MLRIDILTPFPDMVTAAVATSILGRAADKGIVSYHTYGLYEYADPPHFKIDDVPFGGGVGMILKPEPIYRAFDKVMEEATGTPRVIFPTPDGQPFDQRIAEELSKESHLVFIAGHYKGTDQRVRENLVTDEYSIGDFVVTGGELPALLMIDAVVRLREGVMGKIESAETDSFSHSLLDGPHYTRPREFRGIRTPEVLLSGDHGAIAKWRQEKREEQTRSRRPDLWEKYLAAGQHSLENNDG